MKNALLTAAAALFVSLPAAADEAKPQEKKAFEFHGELLSLGIWRNDSDFDATVPYYDADGQSVGGLLTFAKPQFTYRPDKQVTLFYEGELGMNFWGLNSPDQWYPAADDFFVYKHREIWSEVTFEPFTVKAGYQRLRDPTDLFLSHWMGAVTATYARKGLAFRALLGQLPDSTYEGVDVRENNFVHDNFTFGFDVRLDFLRKDALQVRAGNHWVRDTRVVDKALVLTNSFAGADYKDGRFCGHLYGVLQVGKWSASGVGGEDQDVLAWAVAARGGMSMEYAVFGVGAFVLSPDDDHHGNSHQGAFFYSGKNRSPTMMLTEDEVRDRYDNYDEQMSGTWGSFFLNRAGLAVLDAWVEGRVHERLIPRFVVGTGFTLNPDNSYGSVFAGVEADLVLKAKLSKHAAAVAVAQLFIPGKAGAAFVNAYDLEAVGQVHGFQAGLEVKF